MAGPKVAAFVPCGHQCTCMVCAEAIMAAERRCPLCRAAANLHIRIFRE